MLHDIASEVTNIRAIHKNAFTIYSSSPMYIKEDIPRLLSLLSNKFLLGFTDLRVIVSLPHPVCHCVHITDVMTYRCTGQHNEFPEELMHAL